MGNSEEPLDQTEHLALDIDLRLGLGVWTEVWLTNDTSCLRS